MWGQAAHHWTTETLHNDLNSQSTVIIIPMLVKPLKEFEKVGEVELEAMLIFFFSVSCLSMLLQIYLQ